MHPSCIYFSLTSQKIWYFYTTGVYFYMINLIKEGFVIYVDDLYTKCAIPTENRITSKLTYICHTPSTCTIFDYEKKCNSLHCSIIFAFGFWFV